MDRDTVTHTLVLKPGLPAVGTHKQTINNKPQLPPTEQNGKLGLAVGSTGYLPGL